MFSDARSFDATPDLITNYAHNVYYVKLWKAAKKAGSERLTDKCAPWELNATNPEVWCFVASSCVHRVTSTLKFVL